jgi:ketosteroid isomerase-like protein
LSQDGDHHSILQYRQSTFDPKITERNRKIFTDAIEAVAAGDFEAFWSIFDTDVVFHEAACLPYGGSHKGIEATIKAYGQIPKLYSKVRAVFEHVLASDDIVILYSMNTMTVRTNGNTFNLPVAELFRFRDGKVIEWRSHYFDSNMVAQALNGD